MSGKRYRRMTADDLARWTIHWEPYTAKTIGGWRLNGYCNSWPGEEPVPVVPSDEAAVERLARHLYDSDEERVRVEDVAWVNEPDGHKGLWRDKAREAIRVLAMETYGR